MRGEVKKIFPAEYARVVAIREFDANRVVPLGDDVSKGNQFLARLQNRLPGSMALDFC